MRRLENTELPMLEQPFRTVLGFGAGGSMVLYLWDVAEQPDRE